MLFDQVVIVGEGKPYLAALIVLNRGAWADLAASMGIDPDDPATLREIEVRDKAVSRINACLGEFPAYARVMAAYLTLDPWTVDNNMMTSTLKPRRTFIMENYAGEIETLYEGHGLPPGSAT